MNEQINEQLGLLEKELNRLKNVTDYIGDVKKNAQEVVTELQEVQKSYTSNSEKIFTLYKKAVEDLKRETEVQIKEGVVKFETTGNQIDQTNREKLVETKKLLENYRKTVEATDKLVKTLEAVNFPTRLDNIELKVDNQDKETKTIKVLIFVAIFLVIAGATIGFFI